MRDGERTPRQRDDVDDIGVVEQQLQQVVAHEPRGSGDEYAAVHGIIIARRGGSCPLNAPTAHDDARRRLRRSALRTVESGNRVADPGGAHAPGDDLRPEIARNTLADVQELHELTGLPLSELAAFRPERLALHEVLVRVTANISVPDGNRIEDLGISFRQITRTLLERHVEPHMATIGSAYDATRRALGDVIDRELERIFAGPGARTSAPARRGWWQRVFGGGQGVPRPATVSTPALVVAWEAAARAGADPVERAAAQALARTVSALLVKHGDVWGERSMIARVATDSIDRFRFDSFAPDSDEAGSNLLTRFGQIVYMFFLITPPHLLVDRAWNRGRDVGRYKAVRRCCGKCSRMPMSAPGSFRRCRNWRTFRERSRHRPGTSTPASNCTPWAHGGPRERKRDPGAVGLRQSKVTLQRGPGGVARAWRCAFA